MSLFKLGEWMLSSGGTSKYFIDVDALSDADLEALAAMAVDRLPEFGSVEGTEPDGLRFAEALSKHITEGPLLIVGGVLTTGKSMIVQKNNRTAWGVVIFSRIQVRFVPGWITPLWTVVS